MHILVHAPRFIVIGNNPIGALAEWLLAFLEDEGREHIGRGVVVIHG